MDAVEDLFNELLLPLTKKQTRNEKKPIVVKETPIYENGNDDTTHQIQVIQALLPQQQQQQQQQLFNMATLLNHITSVPTLSDEAKSLMNDVSERLNTCKKHIIEANPEQPITKLVFENTLTYLYYISELLPLFANNKTPFTYRLVGNKELPLIQHTSFVFEYLVTLWGLISHIYRHMDLASGTGGREQEIYTKYINNLDFCIHALREMVAYIEKMTKNQLVYKRFVYRASPTSISNSMKVDEVKEDLLEEIQREKDLTLIKNYFGGLRGINARLHLFYAKKYELSLEKALHIVGIKDILGNGDESVPFVTKENAGHIMALTGFSLQISQYYGTAYKKIRDEESGIYHYTCHKSIYWQCVANFLRASIDFYQYTLREDRIEYGKQALKRAEIIKSSLESFNYTYRETPRLIKLMAHLTTRMNSFFEAVNYKVKTVNHRSSEGVVLVSIEETMSDESNTPSTYQEHMTHLHERLCEKDESQLIKHALSLLFRLRRIYVEGSPKTSSSLDNMTMMSAPSSSKSIEDKLTMVILYERYNWLDYLTKNMSRDANGDEVVLVHDIAMIKDSFAEVRCMIQDNLLKDPDNMTVSTLSNKLSSHLYI